MLHFMLLLLGFQCVEAKKQDFLSGESWTTMLLCCQLSLVLFHNVIVRTFSLNPLHLVGISNMSEQYLGRQKMYLFLSNTCGYIYIWWAVLSVSSSSNCLLFIVFPHHQISTLNFSPLFSKKKKKKKIP